MFKGIKKGVNPFVLIATYFDNGCLEYLEVNKWERIHAHARTSASLFSLLKIVFQTSLSENKSVRSICLYVYSKSFVLCHNIYFSFTVQIQLHAFGFIA